jgi:hypothetical protein
MLSAPTSALVAGAQSLAIALLLLVFGYLVANAAARGRGDHFVYAGLAFPAVCVHVLLLSLLHIVSRGAVFSHPWVVRALTAGAAAGAVAVIVRRRQVVERPPPTMIVLALVLLAVGIAIWCGPIFDVFPLGRSGDTRLHLGWAMQMLNGEATPSSPLTGEIPNYYPWFFHALLAFLANLMPGGRALHALGPIQILHIGGAILSLFLLGREVTKRYLGAATAVIFGALSGGIGYFVAREPVLVQDVRSDPDVYLGDLFLKRSYNSSYNNLTPALPRDIAFALLPAFLYLLVRGVRDAHRPALAAAGVIAGIVGLTGAEHFFFCVLVALVVAASLPRRRRAFHLLPVIVPMIVIWAVWLIPLAVSYVRYGGFADTAQSLVDLAPWSVLGAWGLVTPLAAFGIVRAFPAFPRDPGVRVSLLALACAAALVLASALSGLIGQGFHTLGRAHRYWPLVHLALVPLAAIGVVAAVDALSIRRRAVAAAVVAGALLLLSVPSPILGSLAVRDYSEAPNVVSEAIRGKEGSVLNLIDPVAGGETCVAAVPDFMTHPVFLYTGFRVVRYTWTAKKRENVARVRWADIRQHIPWDGRRLTDNELLVNGTGTGEAWDETSEKYSVDHVITTRRAATKGTFGDAEVRGAGKFVVFSRTDCGA